MCDSLTAGKEPAHREFCTLIRKYLATDYFSDSAWSSENNIEPSDPTILLVQRWRSIANQINSTVLARETIVTLNRNFDDIERVLLTPASEYPRLKETVLNLGRRDKNGSMRTRLGQEHIWADSEATPLQPARESAPNNLEAVPRIVGIEQGSFTLLRRLTMVLEQFRRRREQFERLHELAIAKSEAEAKRALRLESEKEQLERDVVDDQAELSYLKLKLRTIEIQTLPYVPRKENDRLAEGIRRWKLDWADVDNRYKRRRQKLVEQRSFEAGIGHYLGKGNVDSVAKPT